MGKEKPTTNLLGTPQFRAGEGTPQDNDDEAVMGLHDIEAISQISSKSQERKRKRERKTNLSDEAAESRTRARRRHRWRLAR